MNRLNLSIHFHVHKIQSSMYNFRLTMVPTHRQQPLPPLRYVNSFIVPMQQPMLWGGGFYGVPSFYSGPVYQAIAPCQQHPYQYRPPNSGPSRNRRPKKGSHWHKAEPQHPYQYKHESYGAVFYDRSTGVNRCHASIDANNNPGIGKRTRPYSSRPSVYAVRLKKDTMPVAGILIPTSAPSVSPSEEPTSTMSATPTSPCMVTSMETTRTGNKDVQEHRTCHTLQS